VAAHPRVDDLLARGYNNVTVVDISNTALELAKKRIGLASRGVFWITADITTAQLPGHTYEVWHDRAVFHFLTTREQRARYVARVAAAVKPGGHVILGTFGTEAPNKCSGLDVVRYDAASLHRELGEHFRLIDSLEEIHRTPSGVAQPFLYCYFVLGQ
jgi:SAM-dependent methyltransferase